MEAIAASTKAAGQPGRTPIDKGHFGIKIDAEGVWHHGGTPFPRIALAKLFATVLKRDETGQHWLQTPVEKGRIDVEDAPFVAVEMSVEGDGEAQSVRFRDNLDNWTPLDADHRLRIVEAPEPDGPRPYIEVRDGLEARLARPVYYELAELAVEDATGQRMGVWSGGVFHDLGPADDEA